jgi:hypothetical protein
LVVTGIVLMLLWSLVLWFSASLQRRLLAEAERSLDLMNSILVEQTVGILGEAAANLRVIDQWIQSHASSDSQVDCG